MHVSELNQFTLCRARIGNISFSILTQNKDAFNALAGMTMHTHTFTEVLCCIRGVRTICTDTTIYHLHPGEMMIVPPAIRHHSPPPEEKDSVQPAGFGLFAELCSDDPGQDLYSQVAPLLTDGMIRLYKGAEKMITLLSDIMADPQNPRNVYRIAQFLENLTEMPCTVSGEQPSASGSVPADMDYIRLTRLEALINGGFNYDLTLAQAAATLYLSERQLARIVQKHYGMSLQKLITGKRMNTAAKLLSSTNESAEDIGQKVGFQARSSFYLAFRLYFGMTPAEYRRRCQEK
jgi:AraC-like DNA-binding protein